MAVLSARDATISSPNTVAVALSTAQTGNGDSTNTVDRGLSGLGQQGSIVVTSTVGTTPTVTVNILGSPDGVNFDNIAYALQATPETPAVAALTITTAVTTIYRLRPFHNWRYLKLNLSANTNVTLTATAYV